MDNSTVSFHAMGSHIQAWLSVTNAEDAQILNSVPDWFEEWEACFSRFRKESELSRLNRRAGHWMKVSESLLEVISEAVQGAKATNGLFNPLILPALQAVGYGHSFEPEVFIPDRATRNASIADFQQIEIDRAHGLVRLPRDAQIDLGGIAKGW